MTKQIEPGSGLQLLAALVAAVAFLLLHGAGDRAVAQQSCGVGTRVEFDDGGRGVGRIEEIGTQSPHVGWYRISFSWAPKGEWYSPKNWGILIAGTKTRCGQPAATSTAQLPGGSAGGRVVARLPAAGVEGAAGCPFVEPPGKVTRTSPASAALFKRVIYERAAAKVNPDSITAPKKVGLTFLEFTMAEPYRNTLTSSRFGDRRRHDGAPVDAMIYPIKTREMQCDLHGGEVRRRVAEVSHDCFKNRDGDWTCPGRTTKVIENRLIPLK